MTVVVNIDPWFSLRVIIHPFLNIFYRNYMDWEILNVLVKAPRKKYIKKILQYSALVRHCQLAVPLHAVTPIAQQYQQDLELSAEEAHQLVTALVRLIDWAQSVDFDQQKIGQKMGEHLEEQLSGLLVDSLGKLQEEIRGASNLLVSQASKLASFDWQLDMEVASDKGKTNVAVVELQLVTARESKVEHTRINMKGTQFEVFFNNLQKIKEQLSQLVGGADQ